MYNIMDWSPGRMLPTITFFSVSFFNYFLPTVTSAPAANDDDENNALYLNIISIFYILLQLQYDSFIIPLFFCLIQRH